MRWVVMALAAVASIGQLIPMAVLAVAVPARMYASRHWLLRPFELLLWPIIGIAALVFYPFWVVAMITNGYLHDQNAVSGCIDDEGIRLNARRKVQRDWLPWREIRSIRWRLTPPLGSYFAVGLTDGSEVRVHRLPFESPVIACEEIRRRAGLS